MGIRNFNQTFTVPLTGGQYAPERIQFAPATPAAALPPRAYDFDYEVADVALNVIAGVATAVLEIWLCQPGLDPTLDASYAFFQTTTLGAAVGGAIIALTAGTGYGPVGVQIRAKSGGSSGTLQATATFG